MERFTYRVDLAYDGRAFAGFARQPGQRTVESTLVAALSPHIPELEGVSIGGRTDRGVSATHQVVSFWSRTFVPPAHLEAALSAAAPEDLAIHDVRLVPRWFHAQYSARARRYVYLHPAGDEVDAADVDRRLAHLVGTRCFFAFARDTPAGKTTVRHLFVASARRIAPEGEPASIRFDFAADSFLRSQVRVLVSTALRESRIGAPVDSLATLAEAGERWSTARPAPAEGLTLVKIDYEPHVAKHVERQREAQATNGLEPRSRPPHEPRAEPCGTGSAQRRGESRASTLRSSADIGWPGSSASARS